MRPTPHLSTSPPGSEMSLMRAHGVVRCDERGDSCDGGVLPGTFAFGCFDSNLYLRRVVAGKDGPQVLEVAEGLEASLSGHDDRITSVDMLYNVGPTAPPRCPSCPRTHSAGSAQSAVPLAPGAHDAAVRCAPAAERRLPGSGVRDCLQGLHAQMLAGFL